MADNPECGVKRRVAVWRDTRGNGFCDGVRFPVSLQYKPIKKVRYEEVHSHYEGRP